MEWEFEVNDLIWFSESSENPFRFLVKFAEGLDDPYRRRKHAISYVDANKAFEKYITDFGFCSREEIEALSEEQSRSVLVTTENLHGAASRALKVTDFVSGLDLGELQERLVETFLVCLDQNWNYVISPFQYIATFEALLKVVLRDSPSMSWLKWQFDLTGSSVEIAQVPEVSYEDNISVVHVNPEYDIMMSVSHTALGLEDQDQCIAKTKYPGYYFVKVPSFSDDSEEDLLKLTTFRNSKCYLSAAKFRSEIYQIMYDLKMFSDVVDNKTPGNEDFEMKVAPHGPAVQIDETFEDGDLSLSFDLVPAIKFTSWPKCCQEWLERKRAWPPQDLVQEIVQGGFYLVPKASLGGNEELEWRISFSTAEGKLMRAKGLGNRNYCYRMFKMAIKENITSTCKLVTTYHLKTLLLWASERYPPDRWSDENVALCFLGLVDDLLHSLLTCSCPHYFIPELNLFANCSTDHLHSIASKVSAIRKFPLRYLQRPGEDARAGYDNFISAMKEWEEMDFQQI